MMDAPDAFEIQDRLMKGQHILVMDESKGRTWHYRANHTPGTIRLVAIEPLLRPQGSSIHLYEFNGLKWAGTPPECLPAYAAISHIWVPSPEVVEISRRVNRPLKIDVGLDTPHTISWHGLVQAATAAKYHLCTFLWLDLLCLDQKSSQDKALQIKQMSDIYALGRATLIMFGGVAAAQRVDIHSSWIDRAWTLQEAAVRGNPLGLFEWPYQGSIVTSEPNKVEFTRLDGGIATAELKQLLAVPYGARLGKATMKDKPGVRGTWEIDFDISIRCFGNQPPAISALQRILKIQGSTLYYNAEDFESAIWRSLWLRTSKKPQDMVFSSMSVFGVNIAVDYSRSTEELIFNLIAQLAATTQSLRIAKTSPAWLGISHRIPVLPTSGLVPLLPTFVPHSPPIYRINGTDYPAAQLLCNCCANLNFEMDVKESSLTDGHLLCARIFNIDSSVQCYGAFGDWSHHVQVILSGPAAYSPNSSDDETRDVGPDNRQRYTTTFENNRVSGISALCHYDGDVGSHLVMVGLQRTMRNDTGRWNHGQHRLVYLVRKARNRVWERCGTGQLVMDDSQFADYGIARRHVRIGGRVTSRVQKCNCDRTLADLAEAFGLRM